QGAGNDFVLVETDDRQRDWSAVAIAICDRHYGIGADGLLLLLPSDKADCQMRIIDCDGTESEACGNGLRCLVRYFVNGRVANSGTREISVETIPGIRRARVFKVNGKVTKVQTSMGEPKFGAQDIPVIIAPPQGKIVDIKSMINYSIKVDGQELQLNLVSMGNPHAVYFCQAPVAEFPLSRLGPKVENLAIFPRRINFEIARVLNRKQIEARVWERGVRETLACGSGACAITVAARLHGYIDNKAEIKLPGGILGVEWDGVGEVFLSGPAEIVFSGEWPD
ncbi:MAG: diaminopimelate epimerase, partial [Chloroflexi bacterium]|nr:diaminopimelate epimerase [Chloroflexota bacterium]